MRVAIFKDAFPEEKVSTNDQDCILAELGEVLRRTPLGDLPHLKFSRLEGGALIYICADQQSGQWLIRAIDNHRLGSGARLKATDARNIPRPIKVALRVRDNVARTKDELLSWIQYLIRRPGGCWVGNLSQRARDTFCISTGTLVIIRKTGYKIFTGLSHGVVKVLKEPETQKGGGAPTIPYSGSASGGEGDGTPSPSGSRRRRVRGKTPPSIKFTASQQGTLEATDFESMEIVKEEGMETEQLTD
jgi:hypothetical protein